MSNLGRAQRRRRGLRFVQVRNRLRAPAAFTIFRYASYRYYRGKVTTKESHSPRIPVFDIVDLVAGGKLDRLLKLVNPSDGKLSRVDIVFF